MLARYMETTKLAAQQALLYSQKETTAHASPVNLYHLQFCMCLFGSSSKPYFIRFSKH